MSPVYEKCYCAFCKSPRRVYTKRHVGAGDMFYGLVLGFLLGLLIWQEIDPRFFPISVTFIGVSEFVIQIRWRLSLPCKKCGFDPLLYVRSPKRAADRIRKIVEARMANPNLLDKELPLLREQGRRLKSPPRVSQVQGAEPGPEALPSGPV